MGSRPVVRVLAWVVLAAAVAAAQEPQQFRTGTDTVPIYATVTDANGRIVTDLSRGDFEVLDNGKPRTLSAFSTSQQPITIVMMLDRSGSVEGQFTLVEHAAAEFVSHLGPADRARVGSFSGKIKIDPPEFTGDHDALMLILQHGLQPFGPTPLWNATDAAMTAVAGETGRRVVLVFTDGKDAPLDGSNTTFTQVKARAETEDVMIYGIGLVNECAPEPAAASDPEGRPAPGLFASLLRNASDLVAFQARGGQGRGGGGGAGRGGQGRGGGGTGRGGTGRTGAPPKNPRGPIAIPMPRLPGGTRMPPARPPGVEPRSGVGEYGAGCSKSKPDPNLRALAAIGGGGYFELREKDDLSFTFARVADELHQQYLLAFVATDRDGLLHKLDVRVRRPNVTVRARAGYIAPR